MLRVRVHGLSAVLLLLGSTATARATWSIIIIDTRTKEIAVGSATCVSGADLKRSVPVVRVGVGAACAQSLVDTSGQNRLLIWNELIRGTDPNEILHLLEARDPGHQTRQYGIADVHGRGVTFSGANNGAYAGGLLGRLGTIFYTIQGNVITGQPVLLEAERRLREEPGGIPERLMAAMEGARSMGGDGRCSCSPKDPTGCGSPPADFGRTAYIGFILSARRGDIDDPSCGPGGCAQGEYYMCFNIEGVGPAARDPVPKLRMMFDEWRLTLVGVPDAIESLVTVDPPLVLNDGGSTATLRIELRDYQGLPGTNFTGITLVHDAELGSAGSSTIGPLVDLGGGVFEAQLTAGTLAGHDRFLITATYPDDADADTDEERVLLMPSAELVVQDARADFNGDGAVTLEDLALLLEAFGQSDGGDVDGDGDTDLEDLALLLGSLPSDGGG